VVVVNIGYRLSIEGFLDIEGAPPNRAVLDWLCALEWVQENITAFGGDPDKVTIGGQSAGPAACLTLLTNPRARGLFSRVIAMSGTSDTRMQREASAELAARIAGHFDVRPTLDELAVFTPEELIEAYVAVAEDPFGGDMTRFDPRRPALRPFVDGEVIPAHPYREIAAAVGRDRPLLAGSTAEEISAVARLRTGGEEAKVTKALDALRLTGDRLERYMKHLGTTDIVTAYGQAATDRSFRVPLADLLEDRAETDATSFGYQFKWRSPVFDGAAGAVHCIDIPFVFDNLDAERVADGMIGADPPESLLSMHTDWVEFIAGRDPWPSYTTERRAVMEYDAEACRVVEDPLRVVREIFG
jgi:para-nitrobenzyl esterase